MSRAIDADALEKEGWKLHRTIQVDKNTSEYQIKPLKQVPTIELERWIPCSERLPEDGLYLVTTSKGQVQVHVFSHNGNSEEYWMRCNKAWMPLPHPYENKGEN